MLTLTVTGFIWLIIVLVFLFLPIKYMKALTIISMIFQGSIFCYFKDTESDVSIILITIFFLAIKQFLINFNFKIILNKQTTNLFLFFVISLLLSIITTNIFKGYLVERYSIFNSIIYHQGYDSVTFDSSIIKQFIILFAYVFGYMLVAQPEEDKLQNQEFYFKILKICITLVMIFGIIQYLESNRILHTNITSTLIHNGVYTIQNNAFYRNYNRLFSSFIEPSYCGIWLNACFWSLFITKKNLKVNPFYLAVTLLLLCFSISGTGIATFVLCFGLFFIMELKKDIKKYILTFLCALIILIFTPIGQEIIKQITSKLSSDSGVDRAFMNSLSIKAFFDSFGFGIGYTKVLGSTIFHTLLGQLGIIGLALFFYFLIFDIKCDFNSKNIYTKVSNILLISTVLATFFSFTGITHCSPLWFALYFNEAISMKNERNINNENSDRRNFFMSQKSNRRSKSSL